MVWQYNASTLPTQLQMLWMLQRNLVSIRNTEAQAAMDPIYCSGLLKSR